MCCHVRPDETLELQHYQQLSCLSAYTYRILSLFDELLATCFRTCNVLLLRWDTRSIRTVAKGRVIDRTENVRTNLVQPPPLCENTAQQNRSNRGTAPSRPLHLLPSICLHLLHQAAAEAVPGWLPGTFAFATMPEPPPPLDPLPAFMLASSSLISLPVSDSLSSSS